MIDSRRKLVAFLSDPTIDPDRDVGELLALAEDMASLKDQLPSLLGLLRIWLRDLLLGEAEKSPDKASEHMAPAKNWHSRELFAKLQAIDRAEKELFRNCNRNLVCEVLLFTLQSPRFAAGYNAR